MIEAQNSETRDAGFGWMINHLPTIVWQRRYYAFSVFAGFPDRVCDRSLHAAHHVPLQGDAAHRIAGTAEDVAQTPGTGAIEQRIAKIREKVLSRGDLIALIEQYDLYPSERRSQPLSTVIDKMRKATSVGALQGDIGTANTGKSNVIALNMSFDYPEPQKAQEVLQNFAQSFLRMDSDVTEDQASLTVRFLEDQAQKLQSQIQQIESEITALKSQNGAVLAGTGSPAMMDTGSYSAQIVTLENENRQLLLQARRPPARDQAIAAAEADLAAKRAIYAENHPDVVAAREKLKAVRSASVTPDTSDTSAVQEQIRT